MLRGRLRRIERTARGDLIVIPQKDGGFSRFTSEELAAAFRRALDRELGRTDAPEHPMSVAARNSSDPAWRKSIIAQGGQTGRPVPDLSEK